MQIPEFQINKSKFDNMCSLMSTNSIIENGKAVATIHHLGQEYVITGAMGNGTGTGWKLLYARRVIDLAKYEGDTPKSYHEHHFKNGYEGLLIKFLKRDIVLLNEVIFKSVQMELQTTLF
jgi:hypothetical protein